MDGERDVNYITMRRASLLTGIEAQTLRKLADSATISCYRTPSGQRRLNLNSIRKLQCENESVSKEAKQNYMYARISTRKQVDDLSRQIKFLKTNPEHADYVLIQDIGSGINFKRKGLQTLLDSCLQRTIGEVVIAHRDRLCRFGFELIESLVTKSGGKITVLDNSHDRTSEQELADDLLSIVHVFSCRQMGKRNYRTRKTKDNKNSIIPNSTTEEET